MKKKGIAGGIKHLQNYISTNNINVIKVYISFGYFKRIKTFKIKKQNRAYSLFF